jgi:hypothetical protein
LIAHKAACTKEITILFVRRHDGSAKMQAVRPYLVLADRKRTQRNGTFQ